MMSTFDYINDKLVLNQVSQHKLKKPEKRLLTIFKKVAELYGATANKVYNSAQDVSDENLINKKIISNQGSDIENAEQLQGWFIREQPIIKFETMKYGRIHTIILNLGEGTMLSNRWGTINHEDPTQMFTSTIFHPKQSTAYAKGSVRTLSSHTTGGSESPTKAYMTLRTVIDKIIGKADEDIERKEKENKAGKEQQEKDARKDIEDKQRAKIEDKKQVIWDPKTVVQQRVGGFVKSLIDRKTGKLKAKFKHPPDLNKMVREHLHRNFFTNNVRAKDYTGFAIWNRIKNNPEERKKYDTSVGSEFEKVPDTNDELINLLEYYIKQSFRESENAPAHSVYKEKGDFWEKQSLPPETIAEQINRRSNRVIIKLRKRNAKRRSRLYH